MANGNGQYQVGDTFTDPNTGELLEILSIGEDGQAEVRVVPETRADEQSFEGGLLRTAAQGATFGFSDELGGLARAFNPFDDVKGFGAGYRSGRDEARQNLAAFRETNPMAALAAEAAGGIVTGVAGGAALRGAAGLGTKLLPQLASRGALAGAGGQAESARRTAQLLGEGGGLLSKMKSAALIGGLEGAAYGVGAGGEDPGANLGDSISSRIRSGAMGAGVGTLGGGLLGGLGHYGGKALGALREVEPASLGEKGVKAGVRRADEVIAQSRMDENPEQFREAAEEWIAKMRSKAAGGDTEAIEELAKFERGGSSLRYAGVRALAERAATREAADGAIPRLLADTNNDLSETAAQVAGKTGKNQGLLRDTIEDESRTLVARDTVRELQDEIGINSDALKRTLGDDFATGGTKRRLDNLTTRRSDLAKGDYADFSDLKKDGSWGNIVNDDGPEGLRNILQTRYRNMVSSGRAGRNMIDRIDNAVADAAESGSMDKGWWRQKPMSVRELLSGENLSRANPEDLDQLRRGLKRIERQAWKENADLAKAAKAFADDIDLSVRRHNEAYDVARTNYSTRSRGLEVYDEASKGFSTPQDVAFAFENVARNLKDITPAQLEDLQTTFKQGLVDHISDEADRLMTLDDTGASAMRLVKQQVKLLEDAGVLEPKAAAKLGERIKTRVAQTKTTMRNRGITGDQLIHGGVTSGKEELTAAAYLGAGQPGAAGRTMVAGRLYDQTGVRNVANAMSERLAQKESKGLLDVAESIFKSEKDLIRQGLRRRSAIAGLLGGSQGLQQETFGDNRYGGYRPRDVRIRQRTNRLRELQR